MFKTLLLSMLLVLTAVSGDSVAKQDNDKQVKSSAQAAKQAKQHVQGRVLKVDKRKSTYRVKMLKKSGRVVNVDVDKKSGRIKQSKKSQGN